MSFTPLIQNQHLFKNPNWQFMELPFTPVIYGFRHLSATVLEPVFVSEDADDIEGCETWETTESFVRKVYHLAIAILELGFFIALYQICKANIATKPHILFVLASVTTIIADIYMQTPNKIYITSISDQKQETETAVFNSYNLQLGAIFINWQKVDLLKAAEFKRTKLAAIGVIHTAAVTFFENKPPRELQHALYESDVSVLPVELLSMQGPFLLGAKRFEIVPFHENPIERDKLASKLKNIHVTALKTLPPSEQQRASR